MSALDGIKVWDGMNVDVDDQSIYLISGVRLKNILKDVAVLRHLYSGGSIDVPLGGRGHELIDVEAARRKILRAFNDALINDDLDDDDLDDDDRSHMDEPYDGPLGAGDGRFIDGDG